MTISTMDDSPYHKSSALHGDARVQKKQQPKFPIALKVFIKNLPQDQDINDVMREHLSSYGSVQDMHVYEAKIAGKRYQQMLAVFSSVDEAEQATKLTGTLVGGRHIIVSTHRQYAQSTSKTVGVLNISVETGEEDLWQFFEECGAIRFIHIERLLNSKSYRAEIHFDNAASAQEALKHNNKELKGNTISVTLWSDEPSKEFPIYVSGLPSDIQKEDLTEFFDGCGSIKRIKILKSKQTGEVSATIFFTDSDSAENGLACNGNQISGHTVSVTQRESAIAEQIQSKYMNPLFIVGISRDTKDVDIFLRFQDCGLMNDVKFVASKSGCLKKAVIDFKDAESINKALEMENLEMNGHKLILSRKADVLSGEYPAIKHNKRKYREINSSVIEESKESKKKKKNCKQIDDLNDCAVDESLSSPVAKQSELKKKKKKDHSKIDDLSNNSVDESLSEPKKKKKKNCKQIVDSNDCAVDESLSSPVAKQSELKKRKKKDCNQIDDLSNNSVDESLSKPKKKKKEIK